MIPLDWQNVRPIISSQEEYEWFDHIASDHYSNLGRDLLSLEIGSYCGQTSVLLAQYGPVFAIDLWGDVHNGLGHMSNIGQVNFVPFIQNIIRYDLVERVFPIVSTSAVLDKLPQMAFDIIYVDAAHYYEPAKLDIDRSKRHLAPNGLLVCHDYKRPGDAAHIGVNRAVDEFLESGEFKIKEHFKGLVVLERI